MKLCFLICALLLGACSTYSITMVHTEGTATDVVDDPDTNTPSTTVSLPTSLPTAL